MKANVGRWVVLLVVYVLLPGSFVFVHAQDDGLTETFDTPNLPGWELSPGAVVTNGTLVIPGSGVAFMPGDWPDLELSLRARFTTELAIIFRATDRGSYSVLLGHGYAVLSRQFDGVPTELATGYFMPGDFSAWYDITLQVQATQHDFLVDGNTIFSVVDDYYQDGGALGFQALGDGAAELDDLSITHDTSLVTPADPASTPTASASSPAYQAAAWQRLGMPPGGVGYDIRYSYADPTIWYVTDTNSGLHISTDRGLTWQRSNQGILNDPFDAYHVFSVTVDPHDPNLVWAGTRDAGHIYRSTDGGQTWEDRTANTTTGPGVAYRGFTVDPRSSDIVYAMAEVSDYIFLQEDELTEYDRTPRDFAGGRIFKTEDSGLTWTLIWQGPALARYLWINPTNPDELYASTGIFDRQALNFPAEGIPHGMNCGGVGILKSMDGGQTWDWLGFDTGLTHLTIGSLYMHPQDPQTLLAGGGSDMCPPGPEIPGQAQVWRHGGVYLTHDGGASWQPVIQDDIITAVEFCSQNPQIAYAASLVAVYRSDDGGATWQTFGDPARATWGPSGLQPGTPIDLQTDPADCYRVFINNYDGGNFVSSDGGQTWQDASQGYSGAFVWDVYVDPADARHVLVATGMAPWESWDGGQTWQGLSNPQLVRGAMTLAVDPTNTRHWLIQGGTQVIPMGGIFATYDSGASWAEVQPLTQNIRFAKIRFAPSNPNMVYAAAGTPEHTEFYPEDFAAHDFPERGVYHSTDGGQTWQASTDPQIETTYVVGLAVSPTDPNTVYAGTFYDKGVLKSTDGGISWQPVNQGLPPQPGHFGVIAIDPRGSVFAGANTGLYRSLDQGQTWVQLTAGLDPVANFEAIVFDPTHPDVIYVGTHNMGIYYSPDGGDRWYALNQGLDLSPGLHLKVFSLAISSDGGVLYAGSENFGVFRLGTP